MEPERLWHMISPELLRRYPFFCSLTEEQLRSLALVSDEVSWAPGERIFEIGTTAHWLYVLMKGSVDLYDRSKDGRRPELSKDFLVGEVNPGEAFGISALLGPHELMASAVASKPSRGIRMDARRLNQMMATEPELGVIVLLELAKAIFERLRYARVQLAAARA